MIAVSSPPTPAGALIAEAPGFGACIAPSAQLTYNFCTSDPGGSHVLLAAGAITADLPP